MVAALRKNEHQVHPITVASSDSFSHPNAPVANLEWVADKTGPLSWRVQLQPRLNTPEQLIKVIIGILETSRQGRNYNEFTYFFVIFLRLGFFWIHALRGSSIGRIHHRTREVEEQKA
ncbi:hypothetical protein F2P79_001495 [Pimephales promelas]|nr:hypothetical protein F2P79_001495 [Pimephales promelas]